MKALATLNKAYEAMLNAPEYAEFFESLETLLIETKSKVNLDMLPLGILAHLFAENEGDAESAMDELETMWHEGIQQYE